ncbi:MAG TPA: 23S rRNA (adenine(2503)-C(2))-methyltransferase RlmN [Myxococcota bacterium]|nr:23S rRNA (adenine(2503)-C(2))-methyltransferase RlmN [Myxococcota bacterium]
MSPDPRPNLKDLPVDELRAELGREGIASYRALQIASWLHARGVEDPEEMSDLPRELRVRLAEVWRTRALDVESVQRSLDGTTKAVLQAADGARIEAVAIPDDDRTTLCISTQVGCPLACSFCATGALGFTRNLSTAEIVDQLARMRELLGEERRVTNVVFMGMGEPLLNLPNVLRAISLLLHPKGYGFAGRRVTVSTAGVVPRLRTLLEAAPVNLAVSLHATTDALRDELVPLNRRFPLDVLLGELRALPQLSAKRPVFFEYTLMAGVNDSVADAKRLIALLDGIPSKVNVIPMNPHADSPYQPPDLSVASRFLGELARAGLTVTLRRSRGADIDAACGQLATRGLRDEAAGSAP